MIDGEVCLLGHFNYEFAVVRKPVLSVASPVWIVYLLLCLLV